jgi:sulfotransferase family protein
MHRRQGPTFLIAGAPRSGTTWLYHLLDRHPDIHMAKPVRPEPKFFLIDELYARGLQHYIETWFAGADAFAAAGEKSTNYLESATAAERIHHDLPGVKLVFILREPAQRAYSNWAWSRMNRMETADFATALALEEERERTVPPHLRYARPHAYFSRGLYASMLRRYFDLFPRDQILCLKFDDIIIKPEDLATRLHRFIGVTPRPDDSLGLDVVNPSETGDAMSDTVRRQLRRRYATSNRGLVQLLGPDFEDWISDEP